MRLVFGPQRASYAPHDLSMCCYRRLLVQIFSNRRIFKPTQPCTRFSTRTRTAPCLTAKRAISVCRSSRTYTRSPKPAKAHPRRILDFTRGSAASTEIWDGPTTTARTARAHPVSYFLKETFLAARSLLPVWILSGRTWKLPVWA